MKISRFLFISLVPMMARSTSMGDRRRRCPAFSFLGLTLPAIPDLQMPTSPIEVKLVYQRVLDPMYVGLF